MRKFQSDSKHLCSKHKKRGYNYFVAKETHFWQPNATGRNTRDCDIPKFDVEHHKDTPLSPAPSQYAIHHLRRTQKIESSREPTKPHPRPKNRSRVVVFIPRGVSNGGTLFSVIPAAAGSQGAGVAWIITLIIAASCGHTRWMLSKMSFPHFYTVLAVRPAHPPAWITRPRSQIIGTGSQNVLLRLLDSFNEVGGLLCTPKKNGSTMATTREINFVNEPALKESESARGNFGFTVPGWWIRRINLQTITNARQF